MTPENERWHHEKANTIIRGERAWNATMRRTFMTVQAANENKKFLILQKFCTTPDAPTALRERTRYVRYSL